MKVLMMTVFAFLFIFVGWPQNIALAEEKIQIDVKTKFAPSADVESRSGEVRVFETHIRISTHFVAFDEIPIKASIGGNHYFISDDLSFKFPASLKSRGLHVDAHIPLPIEEEGQYFFGFGINPTFQTAKGANFDPSGFRIRTRAYLVYKGSEDLILEGGATYRSEYDWEIFPYLGLHYQFNDEILFQINSTETEIMSKINYQWDEKKHLFRRVCLRVG